MLRPALDLHLRVNLPHRVVSPRGARCPGGELLLSHRYRAQLGDQQHLPAFSFPRAAAASDLVAAHRLMASGVDTVDVGLDRSAAAVIEHAEDAALPDGFDDGGVHQDIPVVWWCVQT